MTRRVSRLRSRIGAAAVLTVALALSVSADVLRFDAERRANARQATPATANEVAFLQVGERRIPISGAFDALILELAGELDPALVKAVIAVESGFDPLALSEDQAMGLMQIIPDTARHLGLTEPFGPRANIAAGVRYLSAQMAAFGDVRLALAAYNAGPDRIPQYRGLPPFPETRAYVAAVLAVRERLGPDLQPRAVPAGASSLFPIVMEWTDED